MSVGHWLLYWTGIGVESGKGYGYWSGIGSCFALLSIFGVEYRKHNCHIDRCWRIGVHKVDGSPYIVCGKHHPAVPDKVTVEHVHRLHLLHRDRD